MQPWTEAYADIVVGLGIIVAVAAVFVVGPALRSGARAARDDYENWIGNDQER